MKKKLLIAAILATMTTTATADFYGRVGIVNGLDSDSEYTTVNGNACASRNSCRNTTIHHYKEEGIDGLAPMWEVGYRFEDPKYRNVKGFWLHVDNADVLGISYSFGDH